MCCGWEDPNISKYYDLRNIVSFFLNGVLLVTIHWGSCFELKIHIAEGSKVYEVFGEILRKDCEETRHSVSLWNEQVSFTGHYKGHDDDEKEGSEDDYYYYGGDDDDDETVTMTTLKQVSLYTI